MLGCLRNGRSRHPQTRAAFYALQCEQRWHQHKAGLARMFRATWAPFHPHDGNSGNAPAESAGHRGRRSGNEGSAAPRLKRRSCKRCRSGPWGSAASSRSIPEQKTLPVAQISTQPISSLSCAYSTASIIPEHIAAVSAFRLVWAFSVICKTRCFSCISRSIWLW
jgi:hypothetical protein